MGDIGVKKTDPTLFTNFLGHPSDVKRKEDLSLTLSLEGCNDGMCVLRVHGSWNLSLTLQVVCQAEMFGQLFYYRTIIPTAPNFWAYLDMYSSKVMPKMCKISFSIPDV